MLVTCNSKKKKKKPYLKSREHLSLSMKSTSLMHFRNTEIFFQVEHYFRFEMKNQRTVLYLKCLDVIFATAHYMPGLKPLIRHAM